MRFAVTTVIFLHFTKYLFFGNKRWRRRNYTGEPSTWGVLAVELHSFIYTKPILKYVPKNHTDLKNRVAQHFQIHFAVDMELGQCKIAILKSHPGHVRSD